MQGSSFSYPVGGACGDAGNVRSVTVAVVSVLPVTHDVIRKRGSAPKIRMRELDAAVHDVDVNSRTILRIIVCGAKRKRTLVDPVKVPRSVGLGRGGGDDPVFLDIFHLRVRAELLCLFRRHLGGET